MVEGNVIRLSIPPLSEDRRIEIAKVASKYAENANIAHQVQNTLKILESYKKKVILVKIKNMEMKLKFKK